MPCCFKNDVVEYFVTRTRWYCAQAPGVCTHGHGFEPKRRGWGNTGTLPAHRGFLFGVASV